jgi:hypothetical protein
MKEILISAIFIGQTSKHYKNGTTYKLLIPKKFGVSVKKKFDSENSTKVVYESISAFLNNWTNIQHIEH